MGQHFRDVLKRNAAAAGAMQPEQMAEALEAACRRLADLLGACDPSVRLDLLAHVNPCIAALMQQNGPGETSTGPDAAKANGTPPPEQVPVPGPQPMKLPPELLEWYRQNTNMEEAIAQLREVQETGGLELKDFLPELEKEFGLNE